MNILTPINSVSEIKALSGSGANEFYAGFYDSGWDSRFGPMSHINRMSSFGKAANMYSIDELYELLEAAKAERCSLYITMNSQCYGNDEYPYIRHYMKRLSEIGVDGVIVSTADQIKMAKEHGLSAVASTMCGIYNSDIAEFYKKIGTDRIILPRDLSTEEIFSITRNVSGMEYEVFLMRNGCRFSDSYCLGMHAGEMGGICTFLNDSYYRIISKKKDFKSMHDVELNHCIYTQDFHVTACGQCAIYRFQKMGINAVKVVGRSDRPEDICKDVRLTSENISIARDCKSEKEYLDKMEIEKNIYKMCNCGLSCYYPEIRF